MTRRGFTLLETLIACSLGVVVLGVLLGLSSSLWRSYHRADERHSPREDAHFAFLSVRQVLSDAVFYEITEAGARLSYKTSTAEGKLWLDQAGGRLLHRGPNQSSDQILIGTHVKRFRAEVRRRGVVRLTLELDRPSSGAMQALAPLQMVDEVTMPCMAHRDPRNPWHCVVEKTP
jgi:hypothetical protein